MRIVFIFIDGLGIGADDNAKNPCAVPGLQFFNHFTTDSYPKATIYSGLVKPIDAQLGVDGLPQSATGQTALFTGKNASRLIGKHLSGFPNNQLRAVLAEHSILKQFKDQGKRAAFINVYRPIFFKMGPDALLRFLSTTSIANWKAGLPFFSFDDLRAKRAIYHDFTNHELLRKGFNVPEFTPETAGRILVQCSQQYDFCLYEYFKTDTAGHAQHRSKSVTLLFEIEQFLHAFFNHTDLTTTTVLITSDHGNIEDLSVKTHTNNKVPLMVWGPLKEKIIEPINSLVDVTPTLVSIAKKEK
ncbi:MAG: hypothetical protein ACOY90_04145 [Candidatus Zhuqueibacterota bacterium]